jgi:2-isopropylmalate synthase
LNDYRQHSIGSGSKTEAAAYVQIVSKQGSHVYGCGINANIEKAGLKALISAYNRLQKK